MANALSQSRMSVSSEDARSRTKSAAMARLWHKMGAALKGSGTLGRQVRYTVMAFFGRNGSILYEGQCDEREHDDDGLGFPKILRDWILSITQNPLMPLPNSVYRRDE